jgi:hypothetical protein
MIGFWVFEIYYSGRVSKQFFKEQKIIKATDLTKTVAFTVNRSGIDCKVYDRKRAKCSSSGNGKM